jgi:nucleoside-diphosphate-sugar epimerase
MKKICIAGGNGFIGHSLGRKLRSEGHWVRTVDIQEYTFGKIDYTDNYIIGDLRNIDLCKMVLNDMEFDEVYVLACLMGGAGFIFTGDNDADIMHDSALININIIECLKNSKAKVFYSSSACIYPKHNQLDPDNPNCAENSAYPADPDSPYGLEKIFSESLYEAYHRNYGLDIRVARFHNIFGAEGAYNNGKEKAPAALCRKVAEADKEIEVWGDGKQTRSFLYIDECLDGIEKLMNSDCTFPLNIGSDEMISINDLAKMVIDISGKDLTIKNIEGAEGVRGRNSDNKLIYETLGWKPTQPLREGMEKLYRWVNTQVNG